MGSSAEVRARDLRVLSIVQKCTGWLEQEPKRLQTEGIFRVSGSAKVCGHHPSAGVCTRHRREKGLGCLLACALPGGAAVGLHGPCGRARRGREQRALAARPRGIFGARRQQVLFARPCCKAGESYEIHDANVRGAHACSAAPPLPAPSFCLNRGWKLY
jgi:hypothetical protein